MKNIIGKKGEILALNYLKKKRYKIIETNYRNKIGEIDLICENNKTIVFVEVKFRSSLKFGEPRLAVNLHKQNKIRQVALFYLLVNFKEEPKVRFDVIDIVGDDITHIENAF